MIKFGATLPAALIAPASTPRRVDLPDHETTDLHSNMMDDYYKDAATEKFGLVRTPA